MGKSGAKRVKYRDEAHERECRQKREWYERNKQRVIDRSKEDRRKLKDWFKEWKSQFKCTNCGMDHPACLDFHHRDSAEKEFEISRALRHGWSKEKIMVEAAKCDVLCANCHRIHHWEQK